MEYKGYELNHYPKCKEHPMHDGRYQTFKARPYDDANYYWAYTYDKENWNIIYKNTVIQTLKGNFEQIVDIIDSRNKAIKSRMIHW